MATALRIVSLRWALTIAALKKSVWQTIGYVIGLLYALACVVGASIAFYFLGTVPDILPVPFTDQLTMGAEIVRIVMVLLGSIVGILWTIMPLTLSGDGSALEPRRFALYGIADRSLTSGIILSALFGIPALAALLSLLIGVSAYRQLGVATMVTAVFSAFIAVLLFVAVSKALIALAGTLIRSKRGQMILYISVFVLFFVALQVPSQMLASGGDGESSSGGLVWVLAFPVLSAVATWCSWTPWGAAFQLPFDIAQGEYGIFVAHLAICCGTIALAYAVSLWCLRRDRLRGADSKVTTAKGLSWFSRVPDSISGAVSGRLAQYWQRDGRFAMGLILPVLLTIIFAIRARQNPVAMWTAPVTIGLIYPLFESNNLAYDGRAFVMHAVAGVKGSADRWGRARVAVVISAFFIVVTSLIAVFMAGGFTQGPEPVMEMTTAMGGSLGLAFAGIGLAEVLSVLLLYPVPSIDKPFSSPQGRAVSQGFFPFIQMIGSVILILPTAAVLAAAFLTGSTVLLWLVGLVGLVNGIGFLILGVYLGGKIMDRRTPKIIETLDSFASLQK